MEGNVPIVVGFEQTVLLLEDGLLVGIFPSLLEVELRLVANRVVPAI